MGPDHVQAPLADIDGTGQRSGVCDRRQPLEKAKVPEEELDEQRDVADDLDVDTGDLADQPIGGEASHGGGGPQDGGKNDAHQRDLEGVQQANDKGAGEGTGGVVGDDRFADGKAGGLVQKAIAPTQSPSLGCLKDIPDKESDKANNQDGG